jgi:hypothetical protein
MEQEFGQGSRIQVGGEDTVIGSSQAGNSGVFRLSMKRELQDSRDKFGWNKPLN